MSPAMSEGPKHDWVEQQIQEGQILLTCKNCGVTLRMRNSETARDLADSIAPECK